MMVLQAFGLKPYQLSSALTDGAKFDVAAKIPPGATKGQVRTMLQSLLAERFKLD